MRLEDMFGRYAAVFQLVSQRLVSRQGQRFDYFNLIEIPKAIILPNTLADKAVLSGLPIDQQYGGVLSVNTSFACWKGDYAQITTNDYILTEDAKYNIIKATYCRQTRYHSIVMTASKDESMFQVDFNTAFRKKVSLDKLYKDLRYIVSDFKLCPFLGDDGLFLDGDTFNATGTQVDLGLNGGLTVSGGGSSSGSSYLWDPALDDFNLTIAYTQPTFTCSMLPDLLITHAGELLTLDTTILTVEDSRFNVLSLDYVDGTLDVYLNGTYLGSLTGEFSLQSILVHEGSTICTLFQSESLGLQSINASVAIKYYNRRLGRADD
jgi:hypothetical protein